MDVTVEGARKKLETSENMGKVITSLPKKDKLEKVALICELYQSGEFTIQSCCEAVGVPYANFNNWTQPNLTEEQIEAKDYRKGFLREAYDLYQESLPKNEINYMALLKSKVREGLLKKAVGTEYEEVTTEVKVDENGQSKPVSIRKTKKIVLPDTTALIFLAKNVDPENFQERVVNEHSGKVQVSTGYSHLSDEELKEEKAKLEQQLNSPDGL